MFSSVVKEAMKAKNITIRDLVADTGLSSKTVNKARQDEGIAECRLSTLGRIAEALGVSTKDLYGEEIAWGESLREEIRRLRAIAVEAAKVSELIQKHGTLTDEVQGALHALDFELLEYDGWDS